MHKSAFSTVMAACLVALVVGCSNEPPKYDPEPYRAEIEAIETHITKAERERGDGGELSTRVTDLAGTLGKHIENQRRREVVMNLLIVFGENYSQLDVSDIPWELADARAGWKEHRDRLFDHASWFKPI